MSRLFLIFVIAFVLTLSQGCDKVKNWDFGFSKEGDKTTIELEKKSEESEDKEDAK
ncbi:hypothetical protein LCGC14_0690170 [marine sediment metagenome]|uniref:Lipoprotein n=1 Tax=marine sediment metagenome TaxID=412755 RepID=A0A0F9TTM6_9ZZZZ